MQEAKQAREEIQKEMAAIRAVQKEPVNALLSVSDVGEPDSFGKNVKFLGTARTGVVYVYLSCDPAVLLADVGVTLGPDDRCFVHTVGTPTSSGTFNDLGRITIPGRSADNTIYFVVNRTIDNEFQNTFANEIPTFFRFSPRLTIESTALNDPAAVDTNGNPLNGVLTISAFGTRIFNNSLHPGAYETSCDQSSAAASTGFARTYFAALGLPPQVIDQLYRRPMTIKLGMSVSVRGVYFGQYLYSMRFMGN
ncbi:MAG: hypothetical protein IPJ30_08325 [Acidobacteria bacterium]|nr:hypothetical protein [Acidobacteriota bacterium]